MSIFDIFKTKEKPTPSIKGSTIEGITLSYDMSFSAYFKFYEFNPFVASVVSKKSNDVLSKGYELTKGGKTLYNSDLETLIQFSTAKNFKEFKKRIIRDFEITGNAYIYIVKSEIGTPLGMQVLDPRYMLPVGNKKGQLLGYVQNLDGMKIFLKDEIVHMKNEADLKNELIGKSKMTSLFIDMETEKEARDSNLAFFKNNQTPSSIIIVDKDFEANADDLIALNKKLKDTFEGGKFTGGKNKHRSLLAQGISDIIKVQDKIDDMQFIELRKFTKEIIHSIFEVPLSMLGYTETTNYSNGQTQYDIYRDSIEALEDVFCAFMNEALRKFDDKYTFTALKDNLRKLIVKSEIAGKLYKDKGLITLNEAREIIQYDKLDGGDEVLKEVKSESKTEDTKKDTK